MSKKQFKTDDIKKKLETLENQPLLRLRPSLFKPLSTLSEQLKQLSKLVWKWVIFFSGTFICLYKMAQLMGL